MDFDMLKNKNFVVKCESEEDAKKFFTECIYNGVERWIDNSKITVENNLYQCSPERNCYRIYLRQLLELGTEEYFLAKNSIIIKYK